MEHACHQCGAMVDQGVAFCRQCRAPQIRVVTAGSGSEAPPVGDEISLTAPYSPYPVSSHAVQWAQALSSAALAVLIAAFPLTLLLGVPIGPSMLAAGFLCVVLYRRRTFTVQLTAGLGARLGAVCGLMGFGILLVSLAIGASVFHSGAKIRQAMLDVIQRSIANAPDQQAQAQVLDFFQTPAGLTVALLVLAAGFLICSGLGGALGAALLRPKKRP